MTSVTLIDSPVANVANIARALRAAGADVQLSTIPGVIANAEKLVLPGVGAFAAAMAWLRVMRVDRAIKDAVANGASMLGICVGHQVLFEQSSELGATRGLGLLDGRVERLDGAMPVPQVGWNRVRACEGRNSRQSASLSRPERPAELTYDSDESSNPLFDGIDDETPFYFVNSYAVRDAAAENASGEYNGRFTAAVQHGRLFGVQFHPEKSSGAGLRVLRNFVQWK